MKAGIACRAGGMASAGTRRGHSLTEVMVALAILTVVVLSVLSLTRSSYMGTVTSEHRLVALLIADGMASESEVLPYSEVAEQPLLPVVEVPAYQMLLSEAASRSPTMAVQVSSYLEPFRWSRVVQPVGNLKRFDARVIWTEAGRPRRAAISGVNVQP